MGPVDAIEYRRCLEDALRHAALKGVRPDEKPALTRQSPLGKQGRFGGLNLMARPRNPAPQARTSTAPRLLGPVVRRAFTTPPQSAATLMTWGARGPKTRDMTLPANGREHCSS